MAVVRGDKSSLTSGENNMVDSRHMLVEYRSMFRGLCKQTQGGIQQRRVLKAQLQLASVTKGTLLAPAKWNMLLVDTRDYGE